MLSPSTIRHGGSAIALALALAAPTILHAQTSEAPAPASEADAPADGAQLNDIVVTATRRETSLQRTPISISVVNSENLRDRHVQSLYDFADGAIPSLRIATFEARQSALTVGIRGIVPLDANQPAREQGVGIYVDGVYLGRQHGLNAALFDVDRIEVLKGPQGTLFGRNTEGGALNIVTRRPTGEFGLRATAGISNYGGYAGDFHLDLPAVANFSLKVDGVVQYQGATTTNPMPGQAGWNSYNRRGGRAELQWSPHSDLKLSFAYDNGYDENTPFYSQLLNYNPNACVAGPQSASPACVLPGTAYTNLAFSGSQTAVRPLLPGVIVNGSSRMEAADIGVPQQVSVDKTHGFTTRLTWSPVQGLELRSITAWRGVDATQWDNSGGAHRVPLVNLTAACTAASPCAFSRYSLADLRQRQFSQEFQAVGSAGPIDYVAGLFYFYEHVSDDAATPNSVGAVATLDGAGNVVGATYVPIAFCTGNTPLFVGHAVNGCSIDRASEVVSRSYAAYARLTWNVTDALHLTAGGRYTHDKKEGALHFFRNVNYDLTSNAGIVAGNGYAPLARSWDRFNPVVTLAYDVAQGVNAYATFSTGYRSGGASSRTANYEPFNPEDVTNYEVGVKADLFDRHARLNVAGFIMDRRNSQVDISFIQPAAGSNVNVLRTINAPGTTRIRGIEAELTVRPVEGLTLNAAYAYTYTNIPLVPVTYTAGGNSTTVLQQFYIPFTPRNTASGSLDYAYPVGGRGAEVRLHLDANYAQSTQAFDQFATHADASFIVNGRLSLADIAVGNGDQHLTVSVWVRNLFDEQHVFRRDPSNSLPAGPTNSVTTGNISNILGDYGNFNAPRTFGLEATIRL